jgi:hypothetical protein
MKAMNKEPLRDALDFEDARAGYRTISTLASQQISEACNRALQKRGITTFRFNRMDLKSKKHDDS